MMQEASSSVPATVASEPFRDRLWIHLLAVIAVISLSVVTLVGPNPASAGTDARPSGSWVATWAEAPSGTVNNGCASCTIRNVVHTSVGGSRVRVRLSNHFGTAALLVAHATIALPAVPSSAQVAPGTMRELTFGGHAQVNIPRQGTAVSDPVLLDVPADHDLLVSTFTPGYSTPMTFHPSAQQDSFFTAGADAAAATEATALPSKTQSWHFLTGVDVTGGTTGKQTVVAFGDSITDGFGSTSNVNHRWPNFLAGRVLQQPTSERYGVVDAGIGGNRVLLDGGDGFGPAAVERFRRDALDQTGVRTVIVLEGINDIHNSHTSWTRQRSRQGCLTSCAKPTRAGCASFSGPSPPSRAGPPTTHRRRPRGRR